jgi:hypothetical protein
MKVLLIIIVSIALYVLFFVAPFYIEEKLKGRRSNNKTDPEKTNKN